MVLCRVTLQCQAGCCHNFRVGRRRGRGAGAPEEDRSLGLVVFVAKSSIAWLVEWIMEEKLSLSAGSGVDENARSYLLAARTNPMEPRHG